MICCTIIDAAAPQHTEYFSASRTLQVKHLISYLQQADHLPPPGSTAERFTQPEREDDV